MSNYDNFIVLNNLLLAKNNILNIDKGNIMKKILLMILVLVITKTSLAEISCWNGEWVGQGPDKSKCAPGQSCVYDKSPSDESFAPISSWWVCK